MRKGLLIVMFVLLLSIGFITLRFGTALTQEGNPLPILSSIMNLEISNSDFQQFSAEVNKNRYVSKNTGNSRYDVVKAFMEEKGWGFKEQMGAGLIFSKNEEVVIIETRQYSKHYFLWDIPKAE